MTPEDARRQKELDASAATIGDLLPGVWRRIYVNLTAAGFTAAEAFALLQTYILSQAANGVHFNGNGGVNPTEPTDNA